MAAKEFLGRGFAFPLRIGADGSFAMSSYEDDIREAIDVVLSTAAGERVMRPDFGCGIHEMPFAVINGAALARIQSDVREALVKYEPRIEVLGVAVSVGDAAAGKLAITLEYRVRDTNNAFNYVYDYYLHEGNG